MIQLVLLQLQSMLYSCSLHTKSKKKTKKKTKQKNITFTMQGRRVQEISVSYLMFSSILNKL